MEMMHRHRDTWHGLAQRLFTLWLALVVALGIAAQRREVHILAANDMHATIEYLPQVGAIVDSLRALYPSLLVLSAGDNRTGNPLSDMYEPSSYPMVALMNQIGFNASTLGNHEFDMNSLPEVIRHSNFRYICANVFADSLSGVRAVPYQVFDVEGLRVGIVGAVQVGESGTPSTHPDNLHGLTFRRAHDVLGRYEWLSRECDATVLLSHLGYQTDVEMAQLFPWFDLIVGGHTHTQLHADEPLHNGVLITQNKNKLRNVTHITLCVDSGRVVDKRAEYIGVRTYPKKQKLIETLVAHLSDNAEFRRVVARLEEPFETTEEIGCMICDAYVSEGHADIGIQNPGGVRIESMPKGDVTVFDVLKMDPFYNVAVELLLTGEEVRELLLSYSQYMRYRIPFVSGIRCELLPDPADKYRVSDVRLLTTDGQPLDMQRTYRVVTNNYISATTPSLRPEQMQVMNTETADMIMRFLEKRGTVNYRGVRCHIVRE